MRKIRRVALSLVLAMALLVMLAFPAGAANPTVSITVTAKVVSITNTQSTWGIGTVDTSATVYFSATGSQDDDYSQIENTGSVTVDIEIQGTDIEGGSYDWTLSATGTPGSETYGLLANSEATPTVYDIVVKSSSYNDLIAGLVKDDTYDWSMKFLGPTAFNANDDGAEKSATVTLVASASA